MIYTENIGEGLKIQLAVAGVVSKYAEGKDLPKKLTELLKALLFENLKESATDEAMADMLEAECDSKGLDPEEVMTHFTAITENLSELLGHD